MLFLGKLLQLYNIYERALDVYRISVIVNLPLYQFCKLQVDHYLRYRSVRAYAYIRR